MIKATEHGRKIGGVIGCKQFSCSGDAVWRLIVGCRRMLGALDRAAIMAGVGLRLVLLTLREAGVCACGE